MAKHKKAEWEILQQAIEAYNRNTELQIKVKQKNVLRDGHQLDVLLQIEGCKKPLAAEIKKWAQQANLGALINQVKSLPAEGILIADYVNPNMADKLREQQVQFIDTAGNAYINSPPVYVFVKGNKRQGANLANKKDKTGLAFATAGLKVTYALLCNPALVKEPYRKIADIADVALGTVGWVMYDLRAAGFVIERGRRQERRLNQYRDLLNRWVELYPVKLRPKLLVGRFTADNPYFWKDIDIRQYQAYWGEEVAGAKYTDFLKPKVVTIYLPEKAGNKLLLKEKLRAATEWTDNDPCKVIIYRPFWTEEQDTNIPDKKGGVVHPILCYADLVATGDTRNLETVEIIFDKYIAQYLRQNR